VKLADFGHSQPRAQLAALPAGTLLQTPLYRAPEVSLGLPALGPAIDLWSLGAVLAEVRVVLVCVTSLDMWPHH
jgi:serine/threonine protein kinase